VTVSRQTEPSAFGVSSKMARALADTWRIRILAELSVRNLSPSQFVAEVGGELTDIARCFRQLEEWGYVALIEERPGRRGGAAIEHVYEGIGKAHFDTATWENVALSDRDAVSRSILSSYFARISEAVQAGTFDKDVDRHLSWDAVALDRLAWQQLGDRLDEILSWLPEIATDELSSAAETVSAIVGLTSFRSAQPVEVLLKTARRKEPLPAPEGDLHRFGIPPKMAKALSNGWRCRIVMELTARPMSPSQFVEEIGGSISHISRCFRELADWGFVEVIEKGKVEGMEVGSNTSIATPGGPISTLSAGRPFLGWCGPRCHGPSSAPITTGWWKPLKPELLTPRPIATFPGPHLSSSGQGGNRFVRS
jgi:hypothetical protein